MTDEIKERPKRAKESVGASIARPGRGGDSEGNKRVTGENGAYRPPATWIYTWIEPSERSMSRTVGLPSPSSASIRGSVAAAPGWQRVGTGTRARLKYVDQLTCKSPFMM